MWTTGRLKLKNQFLPVSGWVAYAKDPYKDEVMAGVRLYARGKIVAQTRDFEIKTGFTGEFKMRSYLTGSHPCGMARRRRRLRSY